MNFEEFLWLAHLALIALYVFTIGYYVRSRYFKDKEVWETIYDVNRDPHNNPANEENMGTLIGLGLGGHAFVFGMAQREFPIALIILILVAAFCAKRLADVEPVFSQIKFEKRKERRAAKLAENVKGFADFDEPPSGDDDYFSSNAQQEKPRAKSNGSRARSSASGSQPYGVDKRHPDDTALWAKVDDPSATSSERQSAFAKILEREARRGNARPASSKKGDTIRYLK